MNNSTPEWMVSEWLNTGPGFSLAHLRGRVVVLEAFQMLCPGCVSHGLPTLARVRETFKPEDVAVVGLHSVFEHVEAQGHRAALQAFLHEYRIDYPVGIDARRSGRRLPATMEAYGMQGTPTIVVFDRDGQRRFQHFGIGSEMGLGALIGQIVAEPAATSTPPAGNCEAGACPV